jgi:hypothetical protein
MAVLALRVVKWTTRYTAILQRGLPYSILAIVRNACFDWLKPRRTEELHWARENRGSYWLWLLRLAD